MAEKRKEAFLAHSPTSSAATIVRSPCVREEVNHFEQSRSVCA